MTTDLYAFIEIHADLATTTASTEVTQNSSPMYPSQRKTHGSSQLVVKIKPASNGRKLNESTSSKQGQLNHLIERKNYRNYNFKDLKDFLVSIIL